MNVSLQNWMLTAAILAAPAHSLAADAAKIETGKAQVKDAARAPRTAEIGFSHKHGFYAAPFDLKLTVPNGSGELRYTVDGSVPGAKRGLTYHSPIRVPGTTVVRAVLMMPDGSASRARTVTYLFTSDIIRQSAERLPPPGWPYEWGKNVVDYGMDPSVVEDPKYRDAIQPALESLPTYSLVADLDDLFGKEGGIYSNSDQGGREWERPASLELIRKDGKKGFQADCGIRIRGGFSSGGFNPKHGFRIFFRKQYGEGKLEYPVFGKEGKQAFDGFDLRCSQNYSWNIGSDPRASFLQDPFNRDLQRAMGQPAARSDFCHLYINGQYWGLYNTCERPEASFAAYQFGGKKEDYDVVKTGGVGKGMNVAATDGNMAAWTRLYEAAKADLSSNAAYFHLLGRKPDGTPDPLQEVLLDPVNLVDYLLIIWFGGNLDSPISMFAGNALPNNWHALRNRTGREGFKFFIWDAEHTLLDVEEDRVGPYKGAERVEISHPQWLFQRCIENAEFRVLVADRIHRHFSPGGILSIESTTALLRRRVQEIEQAVICESARWGDTEGGSFGGGESGRPRATRAGPDGRSHPVARTRDGEWRTEINRLLNDYLPKRTEIVLFQLWRQGFVSDLTPPEWKSIDAPAGAGLTGTLETAQGEVWYTLNGADPRRVGGEPDPAARKPLGSLKLDGSTVLLARRRQGDEWSPLITVKGNQR